MHWPAPKQYLISSIATTFPGGLRLPRTVVPFVSPSKYQHVCADLDVALPLGLLKASLITLRKNFIYWMLWEYREATESS